MVFEGIGRGKGEGRERGMLESVLDALRARLENRSTSEDRRLSDLFADPDTLKTKIEDE